MTDLQADIEELLENHYKVRYLECCIRTLLNHFAVIESHTNELQQKEIEAFLQGELFGDSL